MRPAEQLFVCYFTYVVILSGLFRDRPHLHWQPFGYLVGAAAFFLLLSKLQRGFLKTPVAIFRDWLPVAFTLVAFREMELFVPWKYPLAFESSWIKLDHLVLHHRYRLGQLR